METDNLNPKKTNSLNLQLKSVKQENTEDAFGLEEDVDEKLNVL